MEENAHLCPFERADLVSFAQERKVKDALRSLARQYGDRWFSVEAIRDRARVRSVAVVTACLESLGGRVQYDRAAAIARYAQTA